MSRQYAPRTIPTKGVSLARCLVGSLDDVAEVLVMAEAKAIR